jgi:hypothetical protein
MHIKDLAGLIASISLLALQHAAILFTEKLHTENFCFKAHAA